MKQALFAALLVFQAIDVATTIYGVQLGAHWVAALIILKIAFVFLVAWLYNWLPSVVLALLCVGFACVCWNNWEVIQRLK